MSQVAVADVGLIPSGRECSLSNLCFHFYPPSQESLTFRHRSKNNNSLK